MVIKNRYPNPLIDRVFKTEIHKLICTKSYGPEKSPVLFILCYAGVKLTQIERNIKKLTEKVYCVARPRVIFTSS